MNILINMQKDTIVLGSYNVRVSGQNTLLSFSSAEPYSSK